MVAPTYTVWNLEEDLLELKPTFKQRVRKGDTRRNSYTLRSDIRTWMKECVSDHWYLRENKTATVDAWNNTKFSVTCNVFIHFRNQRDAVLFKLTWL